MHEALQIIHSEQQANKPAPPAPVRPHPTLKQSQSTICFGSSTVAIHKLRESKWFTHDEHKILCSVVESGFILERRTDAEDLHTKWGIALWKPGYEKTKNLDYLSVCWAKIDTKKIKIETLTLSEFWLPNTTIRINNKQDKTCVPNTEADIRKQVQVGAKTKNMKWHNCQHFAYWCRYERPGVRMHQITNRMKWGNLTINMGMLMMRNKSRAHTSSS